LCSTAVAHAGQDSVAAVIRVNRFLIHVSACRPTTRIIAEAKNTTKEKNTTIEKHTTKEKNTTIENAEFQPSHSQAGDSFLDGGTARRIIGQFLESPCDAK
jgi:hypothetical protein